jgi:hypothetical protein
MGCATDAPGPAAGEVRVYTVRLWCHRGAFRAAVRQAGDERIELVESLQGLAEYFAGELAGPVADDRSPRPR